MGQIFDRIGRLARAYWNDAAPTSTDWAERLISDEDEELRQIIDELQAEPPTPSIPREVMEALGVLELRTGSDAAVVKSAYRRLISQWHPDRHVNASTDEQAHARQRAQEINAAYLLITAYYGHR